MIWAQCEQMKEKRTDRRVEFLILKFHSLINIRIFLILENEFLILKCRLFSTFACYRLDEHTRLDRSHGHVRVPTIVFREGTIFQPLTSGPGALLIHHSPDS